MKSASEPALDYNPAHGVFFWRVPAELHDELAKAKAIGLDFSRPASSRRVKVFYTHEPYAALPLYRQGTPAARAELDGLWVDYLQSWRQEGTGRHLTCRPDLEYHPFQAAGIEYAIDRPHAIIGDQPGLGKTIQAIGVANELQMERVLVICPASVRIQWLREIAKWSTMRHSSNANRGPYSRAILRGRDGVDPRAQWTVISYDLARDPTIQAKLLAMEFDMIVLDELHYLKSLDARRTKAVFGDPGLADRAKKIVGLTGTPLPNRPRECYTAVRSMCWEAIDFLSEDMFRNRYNPSIRTPQGGVFERVGRLPELQSRLRCNLMVRRRKMDVLPQLPAVSYQVIPVEETKSIRKAIEAENLLGIDPKDLTGGSVNLGFDGSISTVRREMGEAMAPRIAEHVGVLMDGGLDKLLLFCWHHMVLDYLEDKLRSWGVTRVDGHTSPTGKARAVKSFQDDPKTRIFLANMLAAGTGTDGLQKVCNHIVVGEPSWVPGENEQAVDRLWRMEQKNGVLAQFLVAPNSVGEYILNVAVNKVRNTDAALDRR
jgi:SWI/SNF-related matrix-associated actin-dependent regulator 1 of chromatin subfamily A